MHRPFVSFTLVALLSLTACEGEVQNRCDVDANCAAGEVCRARACQPRPITPLADAGPMMVFADAAPPARQPVDAAPVATNADASFEACQSFDQTLEVTRRPVDVVWVIDSSGSMSNEASLVQQNMNSFVASIAASGADYRVVVLTRAGFVNVPAPLGTDAARFRYVAQAVSSSAALSQAVARLRDYRDFLRPEATLNFIFVTDDESRMSATDFRNQMDAMLGAQPIVAHAIVSPPNADPADRGACAGPNGSAARPGAEYWQLSAETGGERLSICSADWTALFGQLSTNIGAQATVPCEYELHDPPAGMELDRDLVNVSFRDEAGNVTRVPYVGGDGTDANCDVAPGWRYQDASNPRVIELCPSACGELGTTTQVSIELGCQTLVY